MLRRRLFAGTCMLACGILAGAMICEQKKLLDGILFMILILLEIRWLCQKRFAAEYMDYDRDPGRLSLCLMLGLVVFMVRYTILQPMSIEECEKVGEIRGRIEYLQVKKERVTVDIAEEGSGERVRCSYYSKGKGDPTRRALIRNYGKVVVAKGKLGIPNGPRNPGCFDYQLYLKTKGMRYIFSVNSASSVRQKIPLLWRFRRCIQHAKKRFALVFRGDSRVRGFLRGAVFGDSSAMDEQDLLEFRQNTTAHVLAVSGLHVGFLYAMLRLLTGSRKTQPMAWFIIGVMVLYGEITRWNPSTIRAVLVTALAILSFYWHRRFDLLSAVSAACYVMLLWDPYWLFSASFVMSFLAVAGIAFLTGPMSRLLGRSIGFLASVQLIMIPYTAYTFNTINPMGILINLPIVFLTGLAVPGAMILLITGIILGTYPGFFAGVVAQLCHMILQLNHRLNMQGALSFDICSVGTGELLVIYGIMLFLSSEFCRILILRRQKATVRLLILLFLLTVIPVAHAYQDPFRDDPVIFLDVGQGDAILLRDDGRSVLIDGGGDRERNVGEDILKPALLKNGCSHLDWSILTHLHADHYKGAEELSHCYPIEHVGVPVADAPFVRKAQVLACGDRLQVSRDMSIEVIWPLEKNLPDPALHGTTETDSETSDENENCNVYLVRTHGMKILITGDLLEKQEKDMLEYYGDSDLLHCDVLKVAHHGSNYSSCREFLDAVHPKVAVIQVGAHNFYGHPGELTLKRLRRSGAEILRTDENGAVGLQNKGGQLIIDTMQ